MSVIAFFSAKGAPGVTTAAMLTASMWPRAALLVDCDPNGGDVGVRLPGVDGRPLDQDRGLLTLLPLARRGVDPRALLEHAQHVAGGGDVIVGLAGPEQAAAAEGLWTALAEGFGRLDGHEVIVDVGRLDARSPLVPIVRAADVAVCVLHASVPSVVTTRARLQTLRPALVGVGYGPQLAVLVQAAQNAQRDADGAAAAIQAAVPAVHYLGRVALDRTGAEIFDGLPVRHPERTLLVRSGVEIVTRLAALVGPNVVAPPTVEVTANPARRGRRRAADGANR